MNDSRTVKRDTYRAQAPRLGRKQHEYHALLRHVTEHGFTKNGHRFFNLTDMEAARWLGWERTTVNGRRNELVRMGLARQDGTRRCLVTRNTCAVWVACKPPEKPKTLFD